MSSGERFKYLEGKTMFLCFGAQKAGTSWLHDYFSGHSQFLTSPLKEMHFFDALLAPERCAHFDLLFVRWLHRQTAEPATAYEKPHFKHILARARMRGEPELYFDYFNGLNKAGREFVCDFTPSYSLIAEPGLLEIDRLVAEQGMALKVLFVMRDPVQRYLSALRHKERDGRSTGEGGEFSYREDDLVRGRYDLIIPRLVSAFGAERVHVAFYESIFAAPDTHLRNLTDFLGAAYVQPDLKKRVNSTDGVKSLKKIDSRKLARHLEVFSPVYQYVQTAYGEKVPGTWHKAS
ncbi:MAG: sulfotransferase [Hyphomonadaceae bacterium]|nr:sulfotransferase [Hyphomonadaceae bacterium]